MIAAGDVLEIDHGGIVYRGDVIDGQVYGDQFGRPLVRIVATETLVLRPVRTMTGNGCTSPTWLPVPAVARLGIVTRPGLLR